MALRIVLVHPAIPQNTGNIARLTAATGAELHLIEPLGFQIDEKQVRRAGLDYWPEVDLRTHSDWESFLTTTEEPGRRLWFFSTKANRSYFQESFADGDYLVFGSETAGLDPSFHKRYQEQLLRIPMSNPKVRSLNLANATAAVLFEARRQLGIIT